MEHSEQLIQHKLRQLESQPVKWNKQGTWLRLERPRRKRISVFAYAAAALVIVVGSWVLYDSMKFNSSALHDRIAALEIRLAQAGDKLILASPDPERMCAPEMAVQPQEIHRVKPRIKPALPSVLIADQFKPAIDSTQRTTVALQLEEQPTVTEPTAAVERPSIPIILGRSQGAAYARSKRFSFRLILSDPDLTEQPITVSEVDIVAGIKQKPN